MCIFVLFIYVVITSAESSFLIRADQLGSVLPRLKRGRCWDHGRLCGVCSTNSAHCTSVPQLFPTTALPAQLTAWRNYVFTLKLTTVGLPVSVVFEFSSCEERLSDNFS
ncbi:hypothetical protein Tcan_00715, partial [Toxocara canis]